MAYLYHKVPPTLVGTQLLPLNILKETAPDIYEQEVQKYVGREALMGRTIPIFNCLWNDVVFLSPVHPTKIQQAQSDQGRTEPWLAHFYEIDATLLNAEQAIIFLFPEKDHFTEQAYTSYDANHLEQYSHLSNETIEYFKEMIAVNKKPFMNYRIPHILYKGSIDISGCNIITP